MGPGRVVGALAPPPSTEPGRFGRPLPGRSQLPDLGQPRSAARASGRLADGASTVTPSASQGAAMPAVVVVGAQWGDEGKGKATDQLGQDVDYVVKFNGGNKSS